MRKLFPFTFLLCFFAFASAQTFTVYPTNTVNTTLDPRGSANVYIHFPNVSLQPITLVWEVTNSSYPSQWIMQVCDNLLCYNLPHPIDTMSVVVPGDSGFLKIICIPLEVSGSGTISFHVYDMNNPSSETNVTYNFNATSTVDVSTNLSEENIAIFPSPAHDYFEMNAGYGLLEKGTVKLYDLTGQLLLSKSVNAVQSMPIDVQSLTPGIYLLRYEYKSDVFTRKVVISH